MKYREDKEVGEPERSEPSSNSEISEHTEGNTNVNMLF